MPSHADALKNYVKSVVVVLVFAFKLQYKCKKRKTAKDFTGDVDRLQDTVCLFS